MGFLIKIILHIAANAVAIKVADFLVPGFSFSGNWQDLLLAGAVLGIVNSFIRPIIKLLSFPIILLTLGLFAIIINVAMLFLTAQLVPSISISGFWAGLWAVLIISFTNNIILSLTHEKE
jgi:putative membrane protein